MAEAVFAGEEELGSDSVDGFFARSRPLYRAIAVGPPPFLIKARSRPSGRTSGVAWQIPVLSRPVTSTW